MTGVVPDTGVHELVSPLRRRSPRPPWFDRRQVTHPAVPEPRSLTDARARVEGPPATPAPVRARLRGVPLALVSADVSALALVTSLLNLPLNDCAAFAIVLLTTRGALRVYRPRLHLSVLDELPRAVASVFVTVGLLVIVASLASNEVSGSRPLCIFGALFSVVSLTLQVLALHVAHRYRCRPGSGQRTLIIGAGRVGGGLARTLLEHPELGLLPVGFTDPDSLTAADDLPVPVVSVQLATLSRTLVETRATTVVMAFTGAREAQIVDTVITAHQTGCTVLVVPRMFELHQDGPDVERVRGIPLVRLRPDPTLRPTWWLKRALDVLGASLALLVLSPGLLLIAVGVLVTTGRPLLFWQERIGLDGQSFELCKFRSMQTVTQEESQSTWTIAGDPRMTPIGRVLRRTSLDELPQLVNIIRGEMSFVGPRPERPSFVQQFTSEHERYWARHRVPVGLTGLAQVNGLRGDTSIRERARYDNYYIANWSLWLDVRVLLLTVREVLVGSGR